VDARGRNAGDVSAPLSPAGSLPSFSVVTIPFQATTKGLTLTETNMATRRITTQEKTHLDQDEVKQETSSNISPAVPG